MKNATQSRILLDTNILLAYINNQHPRHEAVYKHVSRLQDAGYDLVIAPQCLYELYVVVTRPQEQNGFGFSPEEADERIKRIVATFRLLDDPPSVVEEWRRLCTNYQIRGKRAHDVRLVAWMVKHGVSELLTLNPTDFQPFRKVIKVRGV